MAFVKEDQESPKLYIAQPDFTKPVRRMQSSYQSEGKPSRVAANQIEQPLAKKKKVKDMTIEEKVTYFAAKPSHVPRAKCEIMTEKRKYLGIIQDYQQDMVTLRISSKAQPVTVPIEQIKRIDIIGF
ncbi:MULTISPECIES: CotO family spore coat protein [Gracilibacillus]|uniref:CotO family spore coat protein n=1 Tax=Gracilibacillus TaxID=74385 RepID=UPI0008271F43|nr:MULTISPECIES: CotO family spore coat protein [Gracilibacillus]